MPEATSDRAGARVPARVPGSGVRLACMAMATRFELLLQDDAAPRLRAAGEEALAVIRRLDAQLSRFRPDSEISRINARAARESVRVEPSVFELLQRAQRLHAETAGAFDITVAPLMRCWGFTNGGGGVPAAAALERARACVGMQLVELDAVRRTVRFARAGVQLDLGAIGKGWAIEQAALTLRELGVRRALVHGGTSSVYGLGTPVEGGTWRVAVEHPSAREPLTIVALENRALGVSAVWGRSFTAGDVAYGHVLDPTSGRPVQRALLAAVTAPSATDADALATALLVLGPGGQPSRATHRPELDTLVLTAETAGLQVWRDGLEEPGGQDAR